MSERTHSPAMRWSVYVLIAVLFAVACAYLSHWQFDRNQERAHDNALIANNYHAKPLAIEDFLPADSAFQSNQEWHPVTMKGTYLTEQQVLVRNRPRAGTNAFEVLVPFQLADGRVVIVDRGYVLPGEGSVPDSVPAAPSGQVTVTARLRAEEAAPNSSRSAPRGQVPTLNIPLVAKETGLKPIGGMYALMSEEQPPAAHAPFQIDAPTEDPGPHLSYAIQWILFAVMGFVFIVYMIRTEIKHRADERDGVAPRKRKKDRDATEEDALLDAEASAR